MTRKKVFSSPSPSKRSFDSACKWAVRWTARIAFFTVAVGFAAPYLTKASHIPIDMKIYESRLEHVYESPNPTTRDAGNSAQGDVSVEGNSAGVNLSLQRRKNDVGDVVEIRTVSVEENESDENDYAGVELYRGRRDLCTPVRNSRRIKHTMPPNNLKIMLQRRAKQRTIVLTFASSSQHELLGNWLCSAKRNDLSNFLVIAFEQSTRSYVESFTGVDSVFYHPSLLQNQKADWNRTDTDQEEVWRRLMAAKVTIIEAVVSLGYHVLVTDADTAFLGNPLAYLGNAAIDGCHFRFQVDIQGLYSVEGHTELTVRHAFNCGVYWVKATALSRQLYQAWKQAFNCEEGNREQKALNLALPLMGQGRAWHVSVPELEGTASSGRRVIGRGRSRAKRDTSHSTHSSNSNDGESSIGSNSLPANEKERLLNAKTRGDGAVKLDNQNTTRIGNGKILNGNNENAKIKLCYLPPALFPNGGVYFANHPRFDYVTSKKTPYVVHTNYMKGKIERKIEMMKAFAGWHLDPVGSCKWQPPTGLKFRGRLVI
eukprot:comp17609_c0_seq1/m.17293 comp17609_c0_seq1/g.17293  ORF comp17609_c0_seq1/g.17293 comp17609_c0_seq1/m.17293 type:complete len:541 (-) comp17609_c0_seq1:467-2089(-)